MKNWIIKRDSKSSMDSLFIRKLVLTFKLWRHHMHQ
jgi:hypothetical protein